MCVYMCASNVCVCVYVCVCVCVTQRLYPILLAGKNFYYGIREHGMGSIMNGISFHGLFRPSGATFLGNC